MEGIREELGALTPPNAIGKLDAGCHIRLMVLIA
jgi:hypothetical protein